MEINSQQQWAKRTLFLIRLLIFSGALNIGLLSSFVYYIIRGKEISTVGGQKGKGIKQKKVVRDSNAERLSDFATMSYEGLIKLIDNQEAVQDGYKVRDLALASLATFHCFNIEKALQGFIFSKRTVFFQRKGGPEQVAITLYPGLGDDSFQAIDHFIKTEKFPFTAKGLFLELQQQKMPREEALLDAFYLSQEFSIVMMLFTRSGLPLPKEYVVDLLVSGDWDFIEGFASNQKYCQDSLADQLKALLTYFIQCRSLMGAKILLRWDLQFIAKNFLDGDLVFFLDLFCENSPDLDLLLKNLIVSSRSDLIWKKAAEKLYGFSNLQVPDPYDHNVTLLIFAPSPCAQTEKDREVASIPIASVPKKIHVVEMGDTLWRLGVRYKISVEKLKEINHLKTDCLKIGTKLIVREYQPLLGSKDGSEKFGE
jgi:LysM repeat protein